MLVVFKECQSRKLSCASIWWPLWIHAESRESRRQRRNRRRFQVSHSHSTVVLTRKYSIREQTLLFLPSVIYCTVLQRRGRLRGSKSGDHGVCKYPAKPGPVHQVGCEAAQRRAAQWPSRHRQDTAGQSHRRRGQRPIPTRERLRVPRDVRRRGPIARTPMNTKH